MGFQLLNSISLGSIRSTRTQWRQRAASEQTKINTVWKRRRAKNQIFTNSMIQKPITVLEHRLEWALWRSPSQRVTPKVWKTIARTGHVYNQFLIFTKPTRDHRMTCRQMWTPK